MKNETSIKDKRTPHGSGRAVIPKKLELSLQSNVDEMFQIPEELCDEVIIDNIIKRMRLRIPDPLHYQRFLCDTQEKIQKLRKEGAYDVVLNDETNQRFV